MLEKVKMALRIMTDEFDPEINDLINAALFDLKIVGVTNRDETDPLIIRAVTTYCRASFGSPDDYDRLKASYDEQKAQLMVANGYTTYG